MIGECELAATAMASTSWTGDGHYNVVLRTDKQNVLSWSEHASPNSPSACRILRALNLFWLKNKVDILPAYVRSDPNVFPDGLTRWTQREIDDWAFQENMTYSDAPERLRSGMSLSYNPDLEVEKPLVALRFRDTSYTASGLIITVCASGDLVTSQ